MRLKRLVLNLLLKYEPSLNTRNTVSTIVHVLDGAALIVSRHISAISITLFIAVTFKHTDWCT